LLIIIIIIIIIIEQKVNIYKNFDFPLFIIVFSFISK